MRDIQQSKRLSLSEVLFQGGVIYFIILFILNVLHLIFSATAVAIDDGFVSYVTNFTSPITAIFISCFLLALQESNQRVVRLDPDDPMYSSRNQSSSFISSLGGSSIQLFQCCPMMIVSSCKSTHNQRLPGRRRMWATLGYPGLVQPHPQPHNPLLKYSVLCLP
ncbi:hypothetical protein C8T65DRAFT_54729 [Cerioporus squamosus]|nr:hypothetical protein C8T65DRAFT_54729 [Cerioporus squamosus]